MYDVQFIPDFVKNAKKRMQEIDDELERLQPRYTTDTERRDALHKVVSTTSGILKDIVMNGSSTAICATNEEFDLNVVPHVTAMYRNYAKSMKEVSE